MIQDTVVLALERESDIVSFFLFSIEIQQMADGNEVFFLSVEKRCQAYVYVKVINLKSE
jgi:hypothetical protein